MNREGKQGCVSNVGTNTSLNINVRDNCSYLRAKGEDGLVVEEEETNKPIELEGEDNGEISLLSQV